MSDDTGVGVAVKFSPLFQVSCPGSQGAQYSYGLNNGKGFEVRGCPPSLYPSLAALQGLVCSVGHINVSIVRACGGGIIVIVLIGISIGGYQLGEGLDNAGRSPVTRSRLGCCPGLGVIFVARLMATLLAFEFQAELLGLRQHGIFLPGVITIVHGHVGLNVRSLTIVPLPLGTNRSDGRSLGGGCPLVVDEVLEQGDTVIEAGLQGRRSPNLPLCGV